jgi:NAD(P)-dependent dehydrogenase (short-subunit alcohol dehydrogenase family)
MNNQKVWFITGAGRGIGVEITKAALAAGHFVVATGRDTNKVSKAIGESKNLLVLKVDITNAEDSVNAVKATIEKFGRIDVLVNNASNFYAGFFEELSMEQIQKQITTGLIGQMLVTRAVLPQMRKQRAGHIFTISSTAGIVGLEFCTAYSASKFGVEGWMESLQAEISQFGINTTLVNPGFFRSELLTEQSTEFSPPTIEDYASKTKQYVETWKSMSGKQPGSPEKMAKALIKIAAEKVPPRRFVAGADAVAAIVQKAETLKAEANAYLELSSDMSFDD